MKLHPFSWVLISLWITSIAVISHAIPVLGLMTALALFAGFLSRGRALWKYLAGLKRLITLILTLGIIQLLFRRGGELLFSFGVVKIYAEGLQVALEVAVRLIILLIAAGILGRLSFIDFRNAFFYLPQELSFMISYVVHLIPLLRERFQHYLQVLRLRGIQIRKLRLQEKLVIYRIISLSVLGSMLHISDRHALTLELRGFRSRGKKTFLYAERLRLADLLVILLLAGLSLLLL